MATINTMIRIQDNASAALGRIGSAAEKTTSAFSGMSKSGGLFKSMLGSNLISNGITSGVTALKNGLGGLMSDLSESSATWQTFQQNMSNLKMPDAKIAKTKSNLQGFAQKTIYSASDMASTYSQLAAVGTKNTTKLVEGFGGLAAASTDPTQAMKTLSQQATQMAAKPMVQWGDFRLMLEQSPAGMAAVAKTMHRSTGQLLKDIQAGKVSTQSFFAAMAKTGTNKNFTNMATQFKTVGQAAQGLKETVETKLLTAFNSASKSGIKFISNLTDGIQGINFNAVADGIFSMFNRIGTGIGNFMKGFKSTFAMTDITNAFVAVKMAVGDVAKALGSMGGGKGVSVLQTLGKISGDGIAKVATGIQAVANWVSRLDPKTIQAFAKALGAAAVAFVALKAAFSIGSKISKAVSTISGVGKALGLIKAPAAAAASAESAAGNAAGTTATNMLKLGGAVLMIGGGVMLAAAGLGIMAMAAIKLAAAGPGAVAAFVVMGVVLAGLIAVVGAFGGALTAAGLGMLAFGAMAIMVGVGFMLIAVGIAIVVASLPLVAAYGAMAGAAFTQLAAGMVAFAGAAALAGIALIVLGAGLLVFGVAAMVAAVGVILLGAGLMIAAIAIVLMAATLPIVAASVTMAATGFMMLAVAMLMFAPMAMIAAVATIMLGAGLMVMGAGAMVAAVGVLLLGVALMVASAGLMLVGAGALVAAAGLMALGAAVVGIVSAFITAGSMMVHAITSAMKDVVSAVSSGIKAAISGAKAFGSGLVSVGADLIKGLIRGVKSMVSDAIAAVGGAVKGIIGKAKSLLHIGSPSKLFKKFGRWTLEGYTIGVNERAESSANAMAAAMGGVVDAGSGMTIDGPQVVGANPGDLLANSFNRAASAVGTIGTALAGLPSNSTVGVTGAYTGTGNTVTSAPTGLGYGGTSTSTTNKDDSQHITQVQPGAIVINGATAEDGESIAAKLEDFLRQRENAR